MFDLRVSGANCLHLSLDALVLDLGSYHILSRELSALMLDLDAALPTLPVTFRDYVQAEQSLADTETYRLARDYWLTRKLPAAPDLPLACDPASIDEPRFERHSQRISTSRWRALKELAAGERVSLNILVSGAYAEVLTRWCRYPHFVLNFTLFNRLPLHPEVARVVGDFTSLTLLEVDFKEGFFFDRLRRLQHQMWSDLEHRHFGGVAAQQAAGAGV
jgi:pyochelin synthetase